MDVGCDLGFVHKVCFWMFVTQVQSDVLNVRPGWDFCLSNAICAAATQSVFFSALSYKQKG